MEKQVVNLQTKQSTKVPLTPAEEAAAAARVTAETDAKAVKAAEKEARKLRKKDVVTKFGVLGLNKLDLLALGEYLQDGNAD